MKWNPKPLIPVSWGEIFDKLTILHIKIEKIEKEEKKINVIKEKDEIERVIAQISALPQELNELIAELKEINNQLWAIESNKREHERKKLFDNNFIELARQVYIKNDRRAHIKNKINIIMCSEIIEEKSYDRY